MFDRVRQRLLHFARVPAEPEPPLGAPGSVRVFRAGRNYYKLRLANWGIGQIGAIIGLCFSFWFLHHLQDSVANFRAAAAAQPAATSVAPTNSAFTAAAISPPPTEVQANGQKKNQKLKKQQTHRDPGQAIRNFAQSWPDWVFLLLHLIEYGAVALFILQLPITYAAVRLEFEQHWYIVTDRSLRIRTGLFSLQEATMSFANLQQVEVKQGPLQRLLGLADVRVQSAGGGGGDKHDHETHDSLHTGVFHSVEHATEIRDLILERLRQFRTAGLGDLDDQHHAPAAPSVANVAPPADAISAAQELLAEARALRQALTVERRG